MPQLDAVFVMLLARRYLNGVFLEPSQFVARGSQISANRQQLGQGRVTGTESSQERRIDPWHLLSVEFEEYIGVWS